MDRAWNTFTHGYSILFTVLYTVNKISTERLDSRFLRSVLKGKITPISIGCCSFFRGVVYCDRNPKNATFKLYTSFFFFSSRNSPFICSTKFSFLLTSILPIMFLPFAINCFVESKETKDSVIFSSGKRISYELVNIFTQFHFIFILIIIFLILTAILK